MNKKQLIFIAILLSSYALPSFAFAQIEITEIFYDRKGTDSGFEWVEIYNGSAQSVNITELGFFENDTNHRIENFLGSTDLSANSHAVLADDPDKFLQDFPQYEGAVFDSVFSLNNTGELIAFKDASGNIIDSVQYDSEWGAGGNGASLQKQENADWIEGLPTPGEENTTTVFEPPNEEEGASEDTKDSDSEDSFSNLESEWPFEDEDLYLSAGENKRAFVGEDVRFIGRAKFEGGEKVGGRDLIWAFGDGKGDRGDVVRHSYDRPGFYSVILLVEHDNNTYRDRVKIEVVETNSLALNDATEEWVEVRNESPYELDVSDWRIEKEDRAITFAKGTHILPEEIMSVSLEGKVGTKPVFLLDGNGEVVDEFVNYKKEPMGKYEEILGELELMIEKLAV
ncbi:MAG: lamin tail domain-containing protein [Candidatus Campbellbacteria bacterium]|nr:lamin tail domain-containing protein [Candidatus Campbellbacteria bacterium]